MAGAGHGHELLPVPGHDVPARELVGATERLAKLPPGDLAGVPPVQAAERDPVVVPVPLWVGGMGRGMTGRVVRVQAGPGPLQHPVAGVPAHVVPASSVREGDVTLPMTGPGQLRVGHVDVLVPEEVNAYIIKQYTHKARP